MSKEDVDKSWNEDKCPDCGQYVHWTEDTSSAGGSTYYGQCSNNKCYSQFKTVLVSTVESISRRE